MQTLKVLAAPSALAALCLLMGGWSDASSAPRAWLASDLIGMKVSSPQGDELGKIEDVVVHPGGQASYAVLSFGGWLGMGDKLFAMPWSVLRAVEPDTAEKDSRQSLVLPLEKERLKSAPGFDKQSWPTVANPDWAVDVDAFYVGDVNPNLKQPVAAAARTSVITWRVTELKGTTVETPAGESLGDIKEIVIDANGRVSYVAVSVGGFLGVADRLVAVPWDSLTQSLGGDEGDEKLITLVATKEHLEQAPQFKVGQESCAEMCDSKWISRVYAHFTCPEYWNAAAVADSKPSAKN